MKLWKFWNKGKDQAYWERNMLALRFAEGWYYDMIRVDNGMGKEFRYKGYSRVLSLEGGTITFHVPDSFHIGNLPEIQPNWDGHTTWIKWHRIKKFRGIK